MAGRGEWDTPNRFHNYYPAEIEFGDRAANARQKASFWDKTRFWIRDHPKQALIAAGVATACLIVIIVTASVCGGDGCSGSSKSKEAVGLAIKPGQGDDVPGGTAITAQPRAWNPWQRRRANADVANPARKPTGHPAREPTSHPAPAPTPGLPASSPLAASLPFAAHFPASLSYAASLYPSHPIPASISVAALT
ncbi:hypothetical protein TSOC_012105 [Tetrabaena socialis]|uniref:Uncharacterized protein n=1 Tax=Tetrabaena socialis TaxID=47790 RepID=A0A2J7ZNW8_9CHLO|nr:hypothetical protein TSOC_012105 [Tetrabaena socialis]|eukprot:PNH01952.1 hypothetical protein TSOC_012105 [Tetrabaena socialis]